MSVFSNTSRQSSNSPFGSPIGQTNNANNSPFGQAPFGTTSPFGAQTGGSVFGGNSIGVFATQVSSSTAFRSSSTAFGSSSTPAFGGSSSHFGGSSPFGQVPAVSIFGSTTPSQPAFGSSFHQSQPAFGSSPFGSTQSGASSQPSFGTPTFGTSIYPAFGSTSTPAFYATSAPVFGSTSTPAFGSSPFGQSSTSAFGQSNTPAFHQSNTPDFGQSSTPAFGQSNTPAFGKSNTPAFHQSNTPAFGQSSTPAFGQSDTPAFGQSNTMAFGQSIGSNLHGSTTSAFGATSASVFGSTSTPASVSLFQPSQPAIGSNLHGSTQIGASSQPSFGSPSTTTFKSSTTPAVSATSTPAFGATSAPVFVSTSTPATGSSPFFQPSTPAIRQSSKPALRQSGTRVCGGTSSPFGYGSSSVFGQSTSASGCSSFGSVTSPFGAQSSSFGGQATTPAIRSPGFGQTSFGGQLQGSRVTPYTQTPDASGTQQPGGRFVSISTMTAYKDKSFEELRWEDYQLGDKGGPNPAVQTSGGMEMGMGSNTINNNNTQSNTQFSFSPAFTQLTANPFPSTTPSNLSAPETSTIATSGIGDSTPSRGETSSPPIRLITSDSGGSRTRVFGATRSPVSSRSSSVFGQATSAYGGGLSDTATSPVEAQSSPAGGQATTPTFGSPGFGQTSFGGQRGGSRVTPYTQTPEAESGSGTQAAGRLVSISAMPAYKDKSHEELRWEDYQLRDTGGPNPIGQTSGGMGMGFNTTNNNTPPHLFPYAPAFTQSLPLFGQTAPSIAQGIPAFGQPNAFGGNLYSTTPSLLTWNSMGFYQATPCVLMPVQLAQPTRISGGFGLEAPAGGNGGTSSIPDQNNLVVLFACLSI